MSDEYKVQQKKEWIHGIDAAFLNGRAKRIVEVESSEPVGAGYPPPRHHEKIPPDVVKKYFELEESMHRMWQEARMSYVYGFFQGSTLLLAVVLELPRALFVTIILGGQVMESRKH